LLLVQVGEVPLDLGVGGGEDRQLAERYSQLTAASLPVQWKQWHQEKFESKDRSAGHALGQFSQIWHYTWGTHQAALCVDYPFPGWHELPVCYQGQGWSLQERTVQQEGPDANVSEAPFVAAQFTMPVYRFGSLWFCNFGAGGQVIEPSRDTSSFYEARPEVTLGQRLWRRLTSSGRPATSDAGQGSRVVYQLQLFVESFQPLTPAEQAQAREFFNNARAILLQGKVESGEAQP